MSRSITPGDGDHRHGTRNGYGNLKCRCEQCRSAQAAYVAGKKRGRLGRLANGEFIVLRHGNYSTYCNWGCRCDECEAAWARYQRERAS